MCCSLVGGPPHLSTTGNDPELMVWARTGGVWHKEVSAVETVNRNHSLSNYIIGMLCTWFDNNWWMAINIATRVIICEVGWYGGTLEITLCSFLSASLSRSPMSSTWVMLRCMVHGSSQWRDMMITGQRYICRIEFIEIVPPAPAKLGYSVAINRLLSRSVQKFILCWQGHTLRDKRSANSSVWVLIRDWTARGGGGQHHQNMWWSLCCVLFAFDY